MPTEKQASNTEYQKHSVRSKQRHHSLRKMGCWNFNFKKKLQSFNATKAPGQDQELQETVRISGSPKGKADDLSSSLGPGGFRLKSVGRGIDPRSKSTPLMCGLTRIVPAWPIQISPGSQLYGLYRNTMRLVNGALSKGGLRHAFGGQ